MSRRRSAEPRKVLPDPVYNSTLAEKFINNMMWDGKKTTSRKIFYTAMDAMRDLSLPKGTYAHVKITQATLDDLEPMMALSTGLVKHLRAAPVFLLQFELPDRNELAANLQDETLQYFLAWQDGEPVAFMKIGPASEDASTIIRDDGTASITGAYALPNVRGQGVGNALLTRCIDWAREAGYKRCGVDFEPTNVEANRFWRRHFQPVCFGVQRLLNIG